ncbi:hypothetical protein J132_03850, partial [Termitomyces sp. J132]
AKKHNEKVEKLVRDNAHLLVYSDGSMREEGDGTRRSTRWGIVGYHLGTEVFVDKGRLGHNTKVYDAELMGIARAVEAAKEYADRHEWIKHVHIYADNTAVVTLAYKPKPRPGQLQMIRTMHTVDNFLDQEEERMVSIEWCPGHEDVAGNERANEEAKDRAEIRAHEHTTLTNAKRMVKERALEKWSGNWLKTPPSGGFAIANRLKPQWKPREHVQHTPREVFSRLTQCRTKHTFVSEYYARFVPDETTGCTCGIQPQTREHIIRKCPRYNEYRGILEEVDAQMELGTLLGTKKGLEAVTKFLAKMGTFTKTGNRHERKPRPEIDDEENKDTEGRE